MNTEMLQQRISNLENALMSLVVAVELGLDIRKDKRMQDLIEECKSVVEGEYED